MAEWDYISIDAAQHWAQGINKEWLFDHPPLYPFFLTILFKFFGSSIVVARMGNIFSAVLTGLILFHTAAVLFNRNAAIWIMTLYFMSPVCIQGVISMDVADTSLLPLVFAFTTHSIVMNVLNPCFKNTGRLALGVGLCFWAKVTSSIALITGFGGGILIFLILGRKSIRKTWLLNLLGVAAGLLGFLLSWVMISSFLWGREACITLFHATGVSLFSQQGAPNYSFKLIQIGRHAVIILAWFSPYFIFTWLYDSWILAGENRTGSDQDNVILLLIGTTLFYFIGYALIGGTNWGFPRYHVAILPLLCLFSGFLVSRFIGEMDRKAFRMFNISILFLVIFLIFFTNDPLYFFNIRMKERLLSNVGLQTLMKHALTIFLPFYGLPIVIGTFVALYSQRIHHRQVFITCLLVGSFATMISLNILQLLAPYRTSTEYGASGKNEVIEKVRQRIRVGDYVLATPQFVYELRDQKIHSDGWQVWESRERFYEYISHQRPSAIIAGLTVNTYEQLKWLLSEDNQCYLDQDYNLERIGTYFLWLKKAAL
ncbi:MAG: ArnT family glycosyltransferase [Syntrophales bacterium]